MRLELTGVGLLVELTCIDTLQIKLSPLHCSYYAFCVLINIVVIVSWTPHTFCNGGSHSNSLPYTAVVW